MTKLMFQSPIDRVYFSHYKIEHDGGSCDTRFNPLLIGSTFHTPSVFGTFPKIGSPTSGVYSSFHCRTHLHNIGRFDHI